LATAADGAFAATAGAATVVRDSEAPIPRAADICNQSLRFMTSSR
jgi:hypothetical protein